MTVAVAACLIVLAAAAADAQCAFDHAAKAKSIKASLVRHYTSCPESLFVLAGYPVPDTSTASGVPACSAILPGYTLDPIPTPPYVVVSPTPYEFGPNGSCKFGMKPAVEPNCAAGGTLPCSNLEIKASCKDIRQTVVPIDNGEEWDLYLRLRVTTDDPISGDMTVIDLPLEVPFPAPQAVGRLAMKTSTQQVFEDLTGAGNGFGVCTQIELLQVAVRDPEDRQFATMGGSTH